MSSINFLPPSFFQAARRRRRRSWEFAIVGLALIAMTGGYLLLSAESRQAKAEVAAMTNASTGSRVNPQLKAQLEQRKEALVDNLNAYHELSSPVKATQILAALAAMQDQSIGLTELVIDGKTPTPVVRVDPKAAAKAKKSSARRGSVAPPPQSDFLNIQITGFGPDDAIVTEYVGRVSRHPLFTDVKLVFSRPVEMGEYLGRGFTISARVALDCEYRSSAKKESVTDAN